MPDFAFIAESVLKHGPSVATLKLALESAYRRGQTDALSPEEMAVLVRHRVQQYTKSVNNLADRIHGLAREIRSLPSEEE